MPSAMLNSTRLLSRPDVLSALEWEQRRREIKRSLGEFTRAFSGFEPAKHHRLLIERLEDVSAGRIGRLMVLMPPGSSKSFYASQYFVPWYLGSHPDRAIVAASHTAELAEKFGRRVRNLIASEEYLDVFGFGLASDSQAAGRWETTKGGEYYAVGVGGAVTGRRADGAIIDDPIRGREDADSETVREKTWEWWKADLRTRLKPGAWITLILTHWHEDDPAGRILPQGWAGESGWVTARDGEKWYVLCLPARALDGDIMGRAPGEPLWPEWQSDEMLRQEEISQGPRNWSALYQQIPAPDSGSFFLAEWLRPCQTIPRTLRVYGASDYAVTQDGGDYTAHVVVGVDVDGRMFLLDVWREQAGSEAWIEAFCDLVQKYRPLEWAEESGQINSALGPYIEKRMRERKAFVYRRQFASRHDKAIRAQAIRGRMAMNGLYIPDGAIWLANYRTEMLNFPAGKHDDQVDATGLIGQLLDHIEAPRRPPEPPRPRPSITVGGMSTATMDDLWKDHNRKGVRI